MLTWNLWLSLITQKPPPNKIKSVISNWNRIVLSIFGRLTVIKSLISLFTHLFTSLPNLDGSMFKSTNQLLYGYLWNGVAIIKSPIIT